MAAGAGLGRFHQKPAAATIATTTAIATMRPVQRAIIDSFPSLSPGFTFPLSTEGDPPWHYTNSEHTRSMSARWPKPSNSISSSASRRFQKGGHDKHLIGYFQGDTGTINQIVHLWKFEDDADRRAHWAAVFANTDFTEGFAAKFRPLVMTQEVKLLHAAPWGPHP